MIKAEGSAEVLLDVWTQALTINRLSVLSRVAADWYVFSETVTSTVGVDAGHSREFPERVDLPNRGRWRYPGELGYGREVTELRPGTGAGDAEGRVAHVAGLPVAPGQWETAEPSPPLMGEHTEEMLPRLLDLTGAEIGALAERCVIGRLGADREEGWP